MPTKKRKNIGWTLQELMFKIAVMVFTVIIGLWCGWCDSYSAFYIAVLVQAVNNFYDASAFLKGYTKSITVFQTLAFIGALASSILSIIHFTDKGSIVDTRKWVLIVVAALSIPIIHYGIEAYIMIRQDRY